MSHNITIEDRVETASRLFGLPPYNEEGESWEGLTDILTDLRHWADENGIDFTEALRVSQSHFRSDQEEERE